MEENQGMKLRFDKVFKGERYLLYLIANVNSYEANIRRCGFNENFPCIISPDFTMATIIGEGMELRAEDWIEKKIVTEFKLPKEIRSKIKDYIIPS